MFSISHQLQTVVTFDRLQVFVPDFTPPHSRSASRAHSAKLTCENLLWHHCLDKRGHCSTNSIYEMYWKTLVICARQIDALRFCERDTSRSLESCVAAYSTSKRSAPTLQNERFGNAVMIIACCFVRLVSVFCQHPFKFRIVMTNGHLKSLWIVHNCIWCRGDFKAKCFWSRETVDVAHHRSVFTDDAPISLPPLVVYAASDLLSQLVKRTSC